MVFKKMKNAFLKIDKNFIFIFLMAIFIMLPYISGNYFNGHDTPYHISTIFGMSKLSILDIYHWKIFGFFANNFGYGGGLFYPQLSHFVPACIYQFLNFFKIGGVVLAIKIFKFIELFCCGYFMYRLVFLITKHGKSSLVAALSYMATPYFIVDFYIRDAMAESLVFVFIPVLFISFYYLLNNEYRKFLIYFVISSCCLINSHFVMTMYLVVFLAVAFLINIRKFLHKDIIKYIIVGLIIIAVICLPTIVPLLEHKFHGNYLVFVDGYMNRVPRMMMHRLNLYNLFWGIYNKDNLTFVNSIVSWLLFVHIVFNYKKVNEKENSFFVKTAIVFVVLSVLLSSVLVDWSHVPKIFQMLQYPWRLITFLGFGLSLIVGLSFNKISEKIIRKDILFYVIVISSIVCVIYPLHNLKYDNNYFGKKKNWFKTERTFKEYHEYLPVSIAKGNLDYYYSRKDKVLVSDGVAKISEYKNMVPKMSFIVKDVNNATIEIPRIYYLGYTIKAIYADGSSEVLKYYENKNGFVEFKLNKNANIIVDYTGTKLDNIANVISILVISGFFIFVFLVRKKK